MTPGVTETHLQAAAHHVREKWKNGCPVCGSRSWTAPGYTSVPLSNRPDVLALGGAQMPCIALVCDSCAYVALLNLMLVQGASDG